MKSIILLFLVCGLSVSCEKKEENNNEIIKIKYGTSFGECIGYCKKDILLEPGNITYTRSGWQDTIETNTCSETLAGESWNILKTGIDTLQFFELSEIFGCPDCADGGAEYIEITTGSGRKHKVTYEYMNEPGALEDIVPELRKLYEKSNHCGF